uniref:Uncharacterized protein n=1 Tax=Moniliophthora roreri TaxID=221103 RepID=A0A0W0G9H1_MONRR
MSFSFKPGPSSLTLDDLSGFDFRPATSHTLNDWSTGTITGSSRPRRTLKSKIQETTSSNLNEDHAIDHSEVLTQSLARMKLDGSSRSGSRRPRYSEPAATTKEKPSSSIPSRTKRAPRASEPPQTIEVAHLDSVEEEQNQVLLDPLSDTRPMLSTEVVPGLEKLCRDSYIQQTPDAKNLSGLRLPEGYTLSPHQSAGVLWMLGRENIEADKHGGINADEMGLGKTLQTLALVMLDPDKHVGPSLVVVQNCTLASQWKDEVDRFFPGTKVKVYHGSTRFCDLREMKRYDIVITTFGCVRSEHTTFTNAPGVRSTGKCRDALYRTSWRRVVLDEAHIIRNPATKGAKACIELPATFRWCLTATPLQNKVTDLYTLFRFLKFNPYSDYAWFKLNIEVPLKPPKSTNRTQWVPAADAQSALQLLHAGLSEVLIRRRKNDYIDGVKVLDIPAYELHLYMCELPEEERVIYDALQDRFNGLLRRFNLTTQFIFVLLLRLRQACLHQQLLLKGYQKDAKEMERDPDAESDDDKPDEYFDKRECRICGSLLSDNDNDARAHRTTCDYLRTLLDPYNHNASQRIKMIIKILESIPLGEKVIVFSSFVTMLDVIRSYIWDKFRCVQYDGGMKPGERENSLRSIREDPHVRVLLMSLKAGGVGLNLAQCNHVILVDVWWNPAVEEQAIGRAHRMGQTRRVHVYKLIAENTIESRMLKLQEQKRALAEAALDDNQLDLVRKLSLGREEVIRLITGRT